MAAHAMARRAPVGDADRFRASNAVLATDRHHTVHPNFLTLVSMSSRKALEEEYPSLKELRVPPEFAGLDEDTEAETIVRLQLWKRRADEVLAGLRDYLGTRQAMDTQQEAEVAYTIATFYEEEPWVSETSREIARGMSPGCHHEYPSHDACL